MVNELSHELKEEIILVLQESLPVIAKYKQSVCTLRQKKEYALEKFKLSGGTDWRHGKYVYAISALHALLYNIKGFIKDYLKTLEDTCQLIALCNGTQDLYVIESYLELKDRINYVELEEDPTTEETEKVKQRSEKWHQIRNKAKITGSTLYKALALDGLGKQKEHFEQVVCGVKPRDPTDTTMKAMEYGTKNEINAVATLVGKILPVLCPNSTFYEDGCFQRNENEKPFLVVSPDGCLKDNVANVKTTGIEIKCPTRVIHTSIPDRYVLQCLSEMEVHDVDFLLYVCWRPDLTSVIELQRNTELFKEAYNMSKQIYGIEKPKRPTKLHEKVPDLKCRIKEACKSATFIGEFPSIMAKSSNDEDINPETMLPISDCSSDSMIKVINSVINIIDHCYQLQRTKASEAVVFLCCDLNRHWSKDRLLWSPVGWFPKGYSLRTETVREIAEKVHDTCHQSGIHVPAASFDGQWHNIAVRRLNGKPLTVLQLQKDVWREVTKIQKSKMIIDLEKLNIGYSWTQDTETKIITCSNGGIELPKTPSKGRDKGKANKAADSGLEAPKEQTPVNEEVVTTAEHILEDSGFEDQLEMLQYISVEPREEEELSSTNVGIDEWANELSLHISGISNREESENPQTVVHEETTTVDNIFSDENPTNTNEDQTNQTGVKDSTYKLTQEDAQLILQMLKTDTPSNKKGQWEDRDPSEILHYVSTESDLKKLRDVEIRVITRYMKRKLKLSLKEYDTKANKVNRLCEIFGLETDKNTLAKQMSMKCKKKTVKRLSELALSMLSKKVPKTVLNISLAKYRWPKILERWRDESPLKDTVKVAGLDEPEYWFYIPEYSERREQMEVRCIDSTHLLTRLRRKCCHGGIEGMTNKPWITVAKQRLTFLSLVMVEDVINPMSMAMALTHFSEPVENAMEQNGDFRAASLCKVIREWWRADDDPAIHAVDRIKMRSGLRQRLLNTYDFSDFPPPTMYVKGFPIQLWEALVSSIDAHTILYAICKGGTYNVRAFSSMMGESFFAELTNQDKRGQGTLTTEEFAPYISYATEQLQTRLDSGRSFVYRTSRSTVYRPVQSDGSVDAEENIQTEQSESVIHSISPRDHPFDLMERRRVMGKSKEGKISMDRNAVQKGSLGVRWEKARPNESKIPPFRKMGFSDIPS